MRQGFGSLALAAAIAVVGLLAALLSTNFGGAASESDSLHPAAAAVIAGAVVWWASGWVAGRDSTLRLVLLVGFVAKLVGMVARYQVSVQLYGGLFDAGFYHASGQQVADWIAAEGFVPRSDPRVRFRAAETTNLAYSVGLLYWLVGARVVTAYVVAATMGYLGILATIRAGIEAVAQLADRRYAALLVFMPTIVYWPSSLGKEAWMLCWLGLGFLGVARLLGGRVSLASLVPLLVGFGAAAWVRPHVAALAGAALVAALVWPSGFRGSRMQQVAGLAVAAAALWFFLGAVLETFARFTDADSADLGAILEGATGQTSQGGSEFEAGSVSGPVSLLMALVTVFFRPFPWETSSLVQLATSLEGVALLALAFSARHRLAAVPACFGRSPYVRFVTIYSIGFAFAYASIGNFGILARQRAQLYPLLLLLLALPTRRQLTQSDFERGSRPDHPSRQVPVLTGPD